MRPGQKVDLYVDAYPGRRFEGHVDSIQSGSGTAFLAAASGKRDRQLRQSRPARAGEDCVRQFAARYRARPRHVGRALREGEVSDAASAAGGSSRSATGGHNPWIVAIVISIATFMEVLDTTIANVALRNIAGGLAVGPDEAAWVVTSYLVANAIILCASSWLCADIWTQALLYGLRRDLHDVLGALRLRDKSERAAALPRAAGSRWRRHGAGLAIDPRQFVSAGEARAGIRTLRDCNRRRADRRADAGRLDHRQLFLALGVSDQCAGRRAVAWARACLRSATDACRSTGAIVWSKACVKLRLRRLRPDRGLPRLAWNSCWTKANATIGSGQTSSWRSRSSRRSRSFCLCLGACRARTRSSICAFCSAGSSALAFLSCLRPAEF